MCLVNNFQISASIIKDKIVGIQLFVQLLFVMLIFRCRQEQSMTRSARFVHGHSLFLDGDLVEMQDIRKLRSVRHVVN